ncbi:hypothetical protein QR680_018729 [Steinernema hermaphroditum]|uniref:C-type lectin domain-containing protein n=1 Tax=Steinernema hermaphroditum TaxID=289476 RepID=A0AA39HJT1_9BILA|nr:hypothetical protein QR680_018729 [Steinernema hermaphroditum]
MLLLLLLFPLFFSVSGDDNDYMKCPFGWTLYNSHCYRAFQKYSNWMDADFYCARSESHLVNIEGSDEGQFLANLISNRLLVTTAWMGGFVRARSAELEWTNGLGGVTTDVQVRQHNMCLLVSGEMVDKYIFR